MTRQDDRAVSLDIVGIWRKLTNAVPGIAHPVMVQQAGKG